ncbi:MAG: class I SAM-dependent methyltransferase, partial [Gemmatimonadaceae bacterium]
RVAGSTAGLREELERRFVLIEEVITVGDREFTIVRPRSAEDLISEEDFADDERLPYWADIWPSSLILAEHVLANPGSGAAVELGCGVGLVTCAALLSGFDVEATDYYTDALAFTKLNSRVNTGREPAVRHLDWRRLPDDAREVPLIFASDVLYEQPYAAAVAEVLKRLLSEDGRAVVADPGRMAVTDFLAECAARGLELRHAEPHAYVAGEIHQTITLYSLSPSASSNRDFTSRPQR